MITIDSLTNFCILFLSFVFYGFLGWFYESSIWAPLEKKQFLNRGFLIGPLCPIYGLVALLDYYCLCWIPSGIGIFFAAAIICCCIEYLISWSFEKIFKSRWWDYSNYPFNLNGRISLYSGILFGILGLLLVKVIHPFVLKLFSKIPQNAAIIIAASIFVLLMTDTILSIICLRKLNLKLTLMYDEVNKITNIPFDILNENKSALDNLLVVKEGKKILVKLETINEKLIFAEKRFIRAMEPKKSKYNDIYKKLKSNLLGLKFNKKNTSSADENKSSEENQN